MYNLTIKLNREYYKDSPYELTFTNLSDDDPVEVADQMNHNKEFIFFDDYTICLRREDIVGYIYDESV